MMGRAWLSRWQSDASLVYLLSGRAVLQVHCRTDKSAACAARLKSLKSCNSAEGKTCPGTLGRGGGDSKFILWQSVASMGMSKRSSTADGSKGCPQPTLYHNRGPAGLCHKLLC